VLAVLFVAFARNARPATAPLPSTLAPWAAPSSASPVGERPRPGRRLQPLAIPRCMRSRGRSRAGWSTRHARRLHSLAYAVNNSGQVVGASLGNQPGLDMRSHGRSQAEWWTSVPWAAPGATPSLNARGQVVGWAETTTSIWRTRSH
jgi:hypothetical protein